MTQFDVRTGCGLNALPPTGPSCMSQAGREEAAVCLLNRRLVPWSGQVRETLFLRLPKPEGASKTRWIDNTLASWWSKATLVYAADREHEEDNALFWSGMNRSCSIRASREGQRRHPGRRRRGIHACRSHHILRTSHSCGVMERGADHETAPACSVVVSCHGGRRRRRAHDSLSKESTSQGFIAGCAFANTLVRRAHV